MEYQWIIGLFLVIEAWEVHCITSGAYGHHEYRAPSRSFRRHVGTATETDWEIGLRESVHQAMLRENYNAAGLREHLMIAPFVGKGDMATPFGDIAVLATGQLYSTHNGYKFIQDNQQNECKDCSRAKWRCQKYGCQTYTPQPHEKLTALWTVKRIRHRDPQYGHVFELVYTVSPISSINYQSAVLQNGDFNYNIPGHVFTIRSDPHKTSDYQITSNSFQGTDKRHNKLERPHIASYKYHQKETGFRPSSVNQNGYKQFVPNIPQVYLPPTQPGHDQKDIQQNTIDPKELELFHMLLDSLSAKTTTGYQTNGTHILVSATEQQVVPTIPVVFTVPYEHNQLTPANQQTTYVQLTTGHLIPTSGLTTYSATASRQYPQPSYIHPSTQHTLKTTTLHENPVMPPFLNGPITQSHSLERTQRPHTTIQTAEVKPIETPITTIHYFMPASEEEMRESHKQTVPESRTSHKPVIKTTRPYYVRKTTTEKTTRYKKPFQSDYSDEEFDLFPESPTQPMKPITQKPLTEYTSGSSQIQPPSVNTDSTTSYVSKSPTGQSSTPVIKQITSPSTKITDVRTLSTTKSKTSTLIPYTRNSYGGAISTPTTEYSVEPTKQTRIVRPTTIYEYSFDSTTKPGPTESKSSPTFLESKYTTQTRDENEQRKSTQRTTQALFSYQPTTTSQFYYYEPNEDRANIATDRPTTYHSSSNQEHEFTSYKQTHTTIPSTTIRKEQITTYRQPDHRFTPATDTQQPTTSNIRYTSPYTQTVSSKHQFTQFNTQENQGHTVTRTALQSVPVTEGQTTIYKHPPQTVTTLQPTFTTLHPEHTTSNNPHIATLYQIPSTFYPHPMTIVAYPATILGDTTETGTYYHAGTTIPNTTPILIALEPTDLTAATLAAPVSRPTSTDTTNRIKATQTQYTPIKLTPAPVPTNDFLADKESKAQESINLKHSKDYSEDEIFGKGSKTTTATKGTTIKQASQSDLEYALFGTRGKAAQSAETKKSLTSATRATPKIIFSNFFRASTNPVTTPTPYHIDVPQKTLEENYITKLPTLFNTVTTQDYNMIPLTQQSYRTSISFQVNKRNATESATEPMPRVEFEPTIKAELKEIVTPTGNFKIYKAELPTDEEARQTTINEVTSEDSKKSFDMLALQLVNHARSIDYLSNKTKTLPKTQPSNKYKRRNYLSKHKRGQRRYNT